MRSTRRKNVGAPLGARSLSGLEIRQLRAFMALVEDRGVTAAAEVLGLAQSTVSEALAALERVLGAQLILRRRGGHGPVLTDAGHALLPHAQKILSAVDDAGTAVAATTRLANAKVHIVANESVTSYVLPGILPQLRQRWPNTRFTVSVATCAGVRDGLASGAFDVGLLLEESAPIVTANDEAVISTPFADRRIIASRVPLILFASACHPLLGGGTTAVVRHAALSAYPLFVSDAAGDFHDLVLRFFKNERDGGPVIETSGSIEGVKKAVVADTCAIGLLPAYALVEELQAAAVARVNLRPAPPLMRLDALLSQYRARHPATENLLAEVGSLLTNLTVT